MTDPSAPLREVRRWMRASTPVNRTVFAGLRGQLPQIAGSLMTSVLGADTLGADIVWRTLSLARGTGHTQRFMDLATATLDSGFPVRAHETGAGEGRASRRVVRVEVDEGSGRPSLVSIDIIVASSDALSGHEAATRALDTIARATWNNPKMAPISMHARVLLAHNEAGNLEASGTWIDTVVDMSALGFADEIARPDELYDHYGAPEYDPAQGP